MDTPILHDKILTIYTSLTGRIAEIECSKNVYKRDEFFQLVRSSKLIIENAVITDRDTIVINASELEDNIRIVHKNLEFPIFNGYDTRKQLKITSITKRFLCTDTLFMKYSNVVSEIGLSTKYPAVEKLLDTLCIGSSYTLSTDETVYKFDSITLKHLIKKSENIAEFFEAHGIVLEKGILNISNRSNNIPNLRDTVIKEDDSVYKKLDNWELKAKTLGLYDNYEIDKAYETLYKCKAVSKKLIIPPVTTISHDCFKEINNPELVEEIVIPDTVESIQCGLSKFKNARLVLGKNTFYFKGYTEIARPKLHEFNTYNLGEIVSLPEVENLKLNLKFSGFNYTELKRVNTVELIEA